MLSLVFLLLQLVIAGLFLFLCVAFVTGGPFVPSSKKAVAAMIKLAHLKPGMVAYDLGSGDGRLLVAAAAKGAKAVGIELNPYLVLLSHIRVLLSPHRDSISVRWGNLWSTNLRKADIVFVYLLPWQMDKLQHKLALELKPDSLVVSNSFIFPHWKTCYKDMLHHIYAFRVPKR